MFSHHASVFRIGKNRIVLVLFAQPVVLSVLSVLIGRSTLQLSATGDISTSYKIQRQIHKKYTKNTQDTQSAPSDKVNVNK